MGSINPSASFGALREVFGPLEFHYFQDGPEAGTAGKDQPHCEGLQSVCERSRRKRKGVLDRAAKA
jgi:hypothetical protein